MTIDFEQLSRSARCDVGHLRSAVALLRQGYRPSFLARYRRDELGAIPEAALWAADLAVRAEDRLAKRKAELQRRASHANPPRPTVDAALSDAASDHELDMAARLLKAQALDATDAHRLAVRLLRPLSGDSAEPREVVQSALQTDDPIRLEAAVAGWIDSLPDLLVHDLRILRSAAHWLEKNARVQVGDITDPQHDDAPEAGHDEDSEDGDHDHALDAVHEDLSEQLTETLEAVAAEGAEEQATAGDEGLTISAEAAVPATEVHGETPSDVEPTATEETAVEMAAGDGAQAEGVAGEASVNDGAAGEGAAGGKQRKPRGKKGDKQQAGADKKKVEKRMSPRQRRRRWLVSVLKPLAGKTVPPHRLTGFQKLMLLRGERSSVAHPRLVYDRQAMVRHLQKVAANFNPSLVKTVRDKIEEVADPLLSLAEQFFWEEQLQRVRTRLVVVAADRFRRDNLRPSLQAKRVLAIDAVGPRSVAVAVVRRSGRVEHTEDIPCQLAGPFRQQMVMRLGELIHKHRVDLLVVSNGPARRAALAAMRDLLAQSQPGSLQWTIVDRSGADLFASSPSGDRHMRNLPRRFRAAAWLALHLVKPLDAVAELDPTRLRLCSYQRELPKAELRDALQDLLSSALAGRGADVNADTVGLIGQMPGVSGELAGRLDALRRQTLFNSRGQFAAIENWSDVDRRQALGFLRVFGGEQALDATAIHPDDYKLAQRLIAALQIPEPPSMPPGYQLPDYTRRAKGGAAGDAAKAGEAAPSTEETAEIAATAEAAEVQSADETGAVAVATEPAEVTTPVAEVAVEPAAEEAPTAQQEGAPELAPEIEGFGESKKPEMVASAAVAQVPEDEPEPEPISHPLPAEEKIRKVIKEWQVGQFRVRQIVQWLCQPFSTDRADGAPATVMGAVPQLSELKPGQAVAGVVVGVTPFGAFVELAPDCNGLVHVSRLTESYLEDPHEAVQVGDVVNAYVMEIDAKRRRVALSCISPERQAALDEQRRQQQQREFGGHGQGGGRGRDGGQGGQGGNFRGRGQQGGQQGGRGGHAEGGRGGQGQGQGQGQGGGRSAGRGGQGGSYGGGGGRGQQGGQQGGQRGGGRNFGQDRGGKFQRRDRKNSDDEQTTPPPRTTRVERAQPAKPLTDGMRTGNEPLRSFSDLMQFYSMRDAPETESAAATAAPESAEVVNNEAVETPPPANEA